MTAFNYQALNTGGKKRSGSIEADSERSARQQLRKQGLTPLDLRATSKNPKTSATRLTVRERSALTRQLSTLVRAALPLDDALKAMIKQNGEKKIITILATLHSQLTEGESLNQALSTYPRCFPDDYRATVAAGEESGHLGEVLERLADYSEQQQQNQQKVLSALIYPAIILLTAASVVILLLAFIVPQIIEVVQQNNQPLPLLTQYLINSSHFIQHHGVTLILWTIALFLGFRTLYNSQERFRYPVHKLLLRIPILRHFLNTYYSARFTHTLGILVASGVPIIHAMQTVHAGAANLWIKSKIEQATIQIQEGGSIYTALQNHTILPPIPLQLIASGESGGNLGEMMGRAAEQQQRELEHSINLSLNLLEPVMTLIMGAVVLLIVLAILLPIFEMNQLIQ